MCASVYALLSGNLLAFGTGEEPGLRFSGVAVLVWHAASSCATGGGSRGGGVFGPLGTTVPWGVSSESAGRPMGPATLRCEVLRDLLGLCLSLCQVFLGWMLVILFGVLSLGSE